MAVSHFDFQFGPGLEMTTKHIVTQYAETKPLSFFPAPSKVSRSRSLKTPSRKPVMPRAPPSSPRNTSSTFLCNKNAERLAEVCRIAPMQVRRKLSTSSEASQASVPSMTDDLTDSDMSHDDQTYQEMMSKLFDTYYDLANSTRHNNQDYVPRASFKKISWEVSPPCESCMTSDRAWASEISNSLAVPMPSPGFPPQLQRCPARKKLPRKAPETLPLYAPPSRPLPPIPAQGPHSAPLPSQSQSRDQKFNTWPLRTAPTASRPRPSRQNSLVRPSTAPGKRTTPPSMDIFCAQRQFVPPPLPLSTPIEKSVWEYDDDEDDLPRRFVARLHIRSASSESRFSDKSRDSEQDSKPKKSFLTMLGLGKTSS